MDTNNNLTLNRTLLIYDFDVFHPRIRLADAILKARASSLIRHTVIQLNLRKNLV